MNWHYVQSSNPQHAKETKKEKQSRKYTKICLFSDNNRKNP